MVARIKVLTDRNEIFREMQKLRILSNTPGEDRDLHLAHLELMRKELGGMFSAEMPTERESSEIISTRLVRRKL